MNCPSCGGDGYAVDEIDRTLNTCERCDGSGRVVGDINAYPEQKPTESYDEWALRFKSMADKKFKGQRTRRILKNAAGFYARFSVAWLYVFAVTYLFVPRLFSALNASDHLANLTIVDYGAGTFMATLLIWLGFVLFGVLTEPKK